MPISDNDFQREISHAQAMILSTPEDAGYWRAYQNGLRRLYHGDTFGTLAMHRLRLNMVNSKNPEGAKKGRGYKAGFEFDKCRGGNRVGRKQVGDVRLCALMVPKKVDDQLKLLCSKSKELPTTLRRRFLENGLISELKKWGIQ